MYFYQHLPEYINPIAFSIGGFNIHWYSLMYLIGFSVVYWLLTYRAGKDIDLIQNSKFKIQNYLILDFLVYAFVGLLIGARLGYVFFYDFSYFFHNPLAIISPFSDGKFMGIFGMSYHGGLIGAILASLLFVKKNTINFWKWADFVIPAVPAGYFFGRMGNFLNGELYGKPTKFILGMYFPAGTQNFAFLQLRHPSQLYEAFFEGLALFLILWLLRNKSKFPGYLLVIYLFGYGLFRFLIELVREADAGLILGLTRGQVLSLGMIVIALIVFLNQKSKESMKIQELI